MIATDLSPENHREFAKLAPGFSSSGSTARITAVESVRSATCRVDQFFALPRTRRRLWSWARWKARIHSSWRKAGREKCRSPWKVARQICEGAIRPGTIASAEMSNSRRRIWSRPTWQPFGKFDAVFCSRPFISPAGAVEIDLSNSLLIAPCIFSSGRNMRRNTKRRYGPVACAERSMAKVARTNRSADCHRQRPG